MTTHNIHDVRRFQDDDEGYLAWLHGHPDGYVLNTTKALRGSYLKLHRSSCASVRRLQKGYTTWTCGA